MVSHALNFPKTSSFLFNWINSLVHSILFLTPVLVDPCLLDLIKSKEHTIDDDDAVDGDDDDDAVDGDDDDDDDYNYVI